MNSQGSLSNTHETLDLQGLSEARSCRRSPRACLVGDLLSCLSALAPWACFVKQLPFNGNWEAIPRDVISVLKTQHPRAHIIPDESQWGAEQSRSGGRRAWPGATVATKDPCPPQPPWPGQMVPTGLPSMGMWDGAG